MKKLASLVAVAVMCCGSTVYAQWLSDWTEFNGHQYRLTEELDWYAAETLATSVGGHLLSVNDMIENQWAADTFAPFVTSYSGFWIGLFQPDGSSEPEGGWTWTSGDSLGFINWQPGAEPNNNPILGNENAANMWTTGGPPGTWNDLAGDAHFLPALIEVVPEPSAVLLLGIGSLLVVQRRR